MDEALVALLMGVGGILTALSIGARMLFRRMARLEHDSDAHYKQVCDERNELKQRVADLEVKVKRVPVLESQVSTLLAEMSTLQQQVRELQTELDAERDSKARLEREIAAVTTERDRLAKEAHDLQTQVGTYERVLTLLNVQSDGQPKPPGNGPKPGAKPPVQRRTRKAQGAPQNTDEASSSKA